MGSSSKPFSDLDSAQIMQKIYNSAGMICTEGWVTGFIGRKIEFSISTTNVANDTIVNTYSENGETLLVLHSVFTDGTRSTMLQVERVA